MGQSYSPGVFSVVAAVDPSGVAVSPLGSVAVAAVLAGVGLVLWARGGPLMRWAAGLVGLGLGAAAGVVAVALIPGLLGLGVGVVHGAGAGGLVGLIGGLVLCRVVTVGACGLIGLTLGVAVAAVAIERGWVAPGPSLAAGSGADLSEAALIERAERAGGATSVDEAGPPAEPGAPSILDRILSRDAAPATTADAGGAVAPAGVDELAARVIVGEVERRVEDAGRAGAPAMDVLPAPLRPYVEAVGGKARRAGARLAEAWSATAPGSRPVWLIGAAVGWALGTVLALALPRHGTMAGSSAVGGAMVLLGGATLTVAAGWTGLSAVGGVHWALAWLALALAGAGVQWSGVLGGRAGGRAKPA